MSSFIDGVVALPGWNGSVMLLLAKATIILIAALGITLAMQRTSAGARHLVWLATLGTLLLVPVLTAWGPLRLAILPAPAAADATTSPVGVSLQKNQAPVDIDNTTPVASGVPTAAALSEQGTASPGAAVRVANFVSGLTGVALVLAIWGFVVACIVVTLAWAGLAVRRIVRHARPLTSADWQAPLYEIADRLGLEDAPRLLQSDEAKMPFACGMLTPTIVLPAEAESWSLDRRRAVLLHELAHVRRRDLLGHTLGRLVCAVYWFHPLVWTAAKRLRSESERACDDLALSCGTRASEYAEHLLDIVTSVRGDSTPLVALAMARRKEFEGRMLAILDPELRHSSPSRLQSAGLIATLVLLSLTVGAIAPVQREAQAAQAPHAAPSPKTVVVAEADTQATTVVPMHAKQYPDSGIPGHASESTSMSKSESSSTFTEMRVDTRLDSRIEHSMSVTSPIVNTITAPAPRPAATPAPLAAPRLPSDRAIQAIAQAGADFGLNVASTVLDQLTQTTNALGAKGAKGVKSPDDRAVLLAKILKTDSSATNRRIAAWGLQEFGDSPIALDALANALRHDSDAKVREMSAWALGEGSERGGAGIDALMAALKSDANDRVRVTSAWALGNMDDRSSVDALVAALSDANSDVRVRAAWAIGNINPKQAPRGLTALLTDKEPRVRRLAAWALFNIEDPATAPALEAAIKVEQDKDVQLDMIRALAAMGEKSVDALRSLLESNDPHVKQMAVRALAGGRATGPWPWPWPEPRPFP